MCGIIPLPVCLCGLVVVRSWGSHGLVIRTLGLTEGLPVRIPNQEGLVEVPLGKTPNPQIAPWVQLLGTSSLVCGETSQCVKHTV